MSNRRRRSAPLEVVLTPVDSLSSGDGFSTPSNRRLPRELLVRRSVDLEASSYPPFRSLWGQGLRIGLPGPFRALGRSYSIKGRVTPHPPPPAIAPGAFKRDLFSQVRENPGLCASSVQA